MVKIKRKKIHIICLVAKRPYFDGHLVILNSIRGSAVLLNFWLQITLIQHFFINSSEASKQWISESRLKCMCVFNHLVAQTEEMSNGVSK